MDSFPTKGVLTIEDEACGAFGRHRMPRSHGRNDDFLDDDDLPAEDDLLKEVMPEGQRLKRLLEIQKPFQDDPDGVEPYLSSCNLLVKIFKVPVALVSLVYDEFQWFKAKVGIEAKSTERCWSFCAHTFTPDRPEVLYVPDALEDERFRDNFLVQNAPNIRFYCGVPLVTQDGARLGALCIIDRKPRVLGKDAFQLLINLAELTARQLLQTEMGQRYKPSTQVKAPTVPSSLNSGEKLRRIPTMNQLQQRRRDREKWFEKGLTEGVLILDAEKPTWDVLWTNAQWDAWTAHAGVTQSVCPDVWKVLQPVRGETATQMQGKILKRIASSESGSCSFLARIVGLDGKCSICVSCDAVISSQPIKDMRCHIGMPPNHIVGAADAEPISFDGTKLIIVFVRHAQESLVSESALTTSEIFYDADNSGALLSDRVLESKHNNLTVETGLEEVLDQSSAEAKREKAAGILSVFQSVDKAQTGKIRRELLQKLIKSVMLEYEEDFQKDMIEQLLDLCDHDHDGFINYEKFVAVLFAENLPEAAHK